jgi:UDPglucose--hexose-1-phosphate uridylyltransferase
MPQLRKDPISGRWVIIASERSKRPDDFPGSSEPKPEAAAAFCPFCAGNESKTPPEVYSLRTPGTLPDQEGWRVRVVPNKFPALARGDQPERSQKGVFEAMSGVGVHEVVIETPDHGLEMSDLSLTHLQEVIETFQARIASIEAEHQYQYVQVFKNKGREAGASLSHPHSQIVATPIIPKRIKEELYGAERLFKKYQECVFCRIIKQETAARERLIEQNGHFCAVTPFASRFPFEMQVYPLRHSSHFTDMSREEVQGLAAVLRSVLAKLKLVLADPPYNLVLHQTPNPNITGGEWPGLSKDFHWHLEILPVLTRVAGFEYGTGFYINPVLPEAAAEFLSAQKIP